jgi:hypothetical protein
LVGVGYASAKGFDHGYTSSHLMEIVGVPADEDGDDGNRHKDQPQGNAWT